MSLPYVLSDLFMKNKSKQIIFKNVFLFLLWFEGEFDKKTRSKEIFDLQGCSENLPKSLEVKYMAG